MSRRKQSHPRHLENDGEIGPTIVNGPQECFQPEDVTERSDNQYLEPTTCNRCHTDFFDPSDFLEHEKVCLGRNLMSVYSELESQSGDAASLPKSAPGSELDEEDIDEDEIEEEGMLQEELMAEMQGEVMEEDEEEDEDLDPDMQQEDVYPQVPLSLTTDIKDAAQFYYGSLPGKGEENKENNSGIGNQNAGEEGASANSELLTQISSMAAAVASGLFQTSNVTLEPMAATKAAVAQFADSNVLPNDTNLLKNMLVDLQKTQIMQWQMIHQLQQALASKMTSAGTTNNPLPGTSAPLPPASIPLPAHLAHPALPPHMTHLTLASNHVHAQQAMPTFLSPQAEKIPKEEKRPSEDSALEPEVKDLPEPLKEERPKPPREEPAAKQSTTPNFSAVSSPPTSLPLLSFTSSTTTPSIDSLIGIPKTTGSASGTSKEVRTSTSYSSASLSALQRETDALKASLLPGIHLPMTPEEYRGYCQRGTVLQRNQYACDDPFFKHKCRFCHKVFGSDSALQIHVRSHTGERPFKCNICGNRFSTKGNLKVHFERHKAKYPHVKMNPNPVPEHLDRLPIPPSVHPPLSSAPSIPTSLPLPSGMMSGDHTSPVMPRFMFPPGGPGGGFFPPTSMGLGPSFMSPPLPRPPGHHHFLPHMPPRTLGVLLPQLKPEPLFSSPKQSPIETPSKPSPAEIGRSPSRSDAIPPSPVPANNNLDVPKSVNNNTCNTNSSSSSTSGRSTISPARPASVANSPVTSVVPVSSSAPSVTPIPPLIPTHPPPMPGLHHSISQAHLLSPPPHSTPIFSTHSLPPTPTSFPLPSPLTSGIPMMRSHAPSFVPPPPPLPGTPGDGLFRNSILPTKTIDPSENLEQYMEVQKSETSKLEQLVKNIEQKITDPNQCVICHRVLSCKSALQMHYRIHTGERPYKCKICGRSFTTKGNLKTHMGVHRAKPPLRMMHQCPVCHKQFTNLLVLQQHIRMHTGSAMQGMPPMSLFPQLDWPHKPFPHMPPHHKPYEPFDLSRSHEPKELDLSNKTGSSRYDSPLERRHMGSYLPLDSDDLHDSDEENLDNLEEEEQMNEDEEAAMEDESMDERDADGFCSSREFVNNGSERGSLGAHSAFSENGDSDRPDSVLSGAYGNYDSNQPLPPTADGVDEYSSNSFFHSKYNTSLAALEERVKAIDSQMAQSSFERFRNSMGLGSSPFFLDKSLSPGGLGHMNGTGDKSPTSPRSQGTSEAGSDGSRDETKSFGSDMGMNPMGFPMLGGLDMSQAGKLRNTTTTCNVCYKTFACRSALEIHYRSHTKERPYRCSACDRSFSTRGNLKQHALTHKIRDLPEGFKGFDDSENSISNTGTNDDCDDKESVLERAQSASPKQSHSAEEHEFQQESEANGNSSSHSPSQPSDSNIPPPQPPPPPPPPPPSSPMQTQISKPSPQVNGPTVPCSQNNNNNASFPNNNNVPPHCGSSSMVKSEPTTPSTSSSSSSSGGGNGGSDSTVKRSKHQCMTCMKIFSSSSALQIHTRTHTGDKPFKCTVCGKAFTTRGNLKVHMGTHMWNNSPSRRGRRMSIDPPFLLGHMRDNPFIAAGGGFPPAPRPPHPDMFYPYPSFLNGMAPKINEISVIQSVNGALGHQLPPMYPLPHPYPTTKDNELKHPADFSFVHLRPSGDPLNRDRDFERDRARDRNRDRDHMSSTLSQRLPQLPQLPRLHPSSPLHMLKGPSESVGSVAPSGELDLSMKSAPQTNSTTSPPKHYSSMSSYPASPSGHSPATGSNDSCAAGASPSNKENTLERRSPSPWRWNNASCHHCGQGFQTAAAMEQHIQMHHVKHESQTPQKALVA